MARVAEELIRKLHETEQRFSEESEDPLGNVISRFSWNIIDITTAVVQLDLRLDAAGVPEGGVGRIENRAVAEALGRLDDLVHDAAVAAGAAIVAERDATVDGD